MGVDEYTCNSNESTILIAFFKYSACTCTIDAPLKEYTCIS